MSRINPFHPNAEYTYEAAKDWRDSCLLDDGSVFGEGQLWTWEHFENLQRCFIENPPKESWDKFVGKLKRRLSKVNPKVKKEVTQLTAEMMWVLYLANAQLKAKTKRERIEKIWSWSSKDNPPNSPYLKDEYLEGLGNFGRLFHTTVWQELRILIFFMQEWKQLSREERVDRLKNSSQFVSAFEGQTQKNEPQLLHILPHLLFHDETERIFHFGHKQKIIEYFTNNDSKEGNAQKLNEVLRKIRADATERILNYKDEQKRAIIKEITENKQTQAIIRKNITDDDSKEWSVQKLNEVLTKILDFYMSPLNEWRFNKRHNKSKFPTDVQPGEGDKELVTTDSPNKNIPLNRIFYGPPGTGKTYQTVEESLKIILPPEEYEAIKGDRDEMNQKFKDLIDAKQIQFITFHQNFSYEDFVEGLKAETDDKGDIKYEVKSGIFKEMCERAAGGKRYASIEDAIEKLKKECYEEERPVKMLTKKEVPIHVSYRGGKTFRVETTSRQGGVWPVSIERIIKVYNGADIRRFYSPSYIWAILQYLKRKNPILNDPQEVAGTNNYVLIIDEINRGNISRIFGELITLIEPSRRAGEPDALEVTLPYSKDPFSVPKNLYIIGTMNTADRSIALLDTALRRRFRFVEMMPKPDMLKDIKIKANEGDKNEEVDIQKLLKAINERIEVLYDRDHQIGHTYFLDLKDDPTIDKLSDIFQHNILPLLQEYFYDDWGKVNIVLNDNGFLEKNETRKYPMPSGSVDYFDGEKPIWNINEGALKNANEYRKIY